MNKINIKLAIKALKGKLVESSNDELIKDVVKLFSMLTNQEKLEFLATKNINYLIKYGIDEDELKNVIDHINDDSYYITGKEYYIDSGWGDYECEFNDSFNFLPILEDAVEYCFSLFEVKDYDKFLKLGKELLSLKIESHIYEEDDNRYCEIIEYDLKETFSNLNYFVDIDKLKKQVFSIIVNNEYNYDDINFILNLFYYCNKQTFEELFYYVSDKSKCLSNIKEFLKEDITNKSIDSSLLILLLNYVNDEEIFKLYAYKYEPISIKYFDIYFEFLKNNNRDLSTIIKDILELFPITLEIEKYLKYALENDPSNDKYRILIYNANSYNIENFFELYRIDKQTDILKIIKKDLHLALATLNMDYVKKLNMDNLLLFLEYLSSEYDTSNLKERTLENIKIWFNSITLENDSLSKLYDYALNKLTELCKEYLGVDRRFYPTLASYIYRMNRLKKGVLVDFYFTYYRYKSFRKELDYFKTK